MSDMQQIQEQYRKMYDAMIRKDEATLASVLDDRFVLVHMTGMRQSKVEFLRAVMDGTLNYFSAQHENMPVSVNGNTATLTGQSYVAAASITLRRGTLFHWNLPTRTSRHTRFLQSGKWKGNWCLCWKRRAKN